MNSTPPTRSRRRRLTMLLCLVLAVVVVTLLLFEWCLHTFDILGVNYAVETARYRTEVVVPTWTKADGSYDFDGTLIRNRPNVDVQFGSFRVKTNSLGFRGPQIEKQKPKDTYRILMLGDSVVFGWGVNDEVTFSRRLERSLNERNTGTNYEVINAGHLIYDTQQELALFRTDGLAVAPDLVILVYVVNDIDPSRDLVEILLGLKPLPELPTDASPSILGSWFPTTVRLLDHLTAHADYEKILSEHEGEYRPENEGQGPRGWVRSKGALLELRDLCRSKGLPLLLLDHSYPEIRSLPPFCAENGIELRAFRVTAEQSKQPVQNSAFDPHLNTLGQEFLWRRLLTILEAENLPPR